MFYEKRCLCWQKHGCNFEGTALSAQQHLYTEQNGCLYILAYWIASCVLILLRSRCHFICKWCVTRGWWICFGVAIQEDDNRNSLPCGRSGVFVEHVWYFGLGWYSRHQYQHHRCRRHYGCHQHLKIALIWNVPWSVGPNICVQHAFQ